MERLLFAGFFLALSTQAISHQDAMMRFQAGVNSQDRWRTHMVAQMERGADGLQQRYASLVGPGVARSAQVRIDPVASGSISLFVNRASKADSLREPRKMAFAAGVFDTATFYQPLEKTPETTVGMAFVLPQKTPTTAVANVDHVNDPPLKSEDPVAIAYAPSDDADGAPFDAVISGGGGGKIVLVRDPPATHAWVNYAIPATSKSKKEKRCLANAIYFEARGEPEQGRLAVAQVVLNRLKNPAYPNTICSVVYQNQQKRNRCQFSFACDGIRDRITDKKSWAEAQDLTERIMADDRTLFISDIGASTHYHATYVKPRWARRMKRKDKIGRHIFYQTYGGGWS